MTLNAKPVAAADAAARAVEASFDGVELHFAHAYTMASFLSARNVREDGYGGDLEGRARLSSPLPALLHASRPPSAPRRFCCASAS